MFSAGFASKLRAKYSDAQPRDDHGRFAGGGAAPSREDLQTHLVDYKADRELTGPDSRAITDILPAAQQVGYLAVPGIVHMHERMGITPTLATDPAKYVEARDELFGLQPVEQVAVGRLIFTQPRINLPRVESMLAALAQDPTRFDQAPTQIIRQTSHDYVMNGHHRVVALVLDGKVTIPAQVLDLRHVKSRLYRKYSDDQPRDDHGRWSDGGGSDGTTRPSSDGRPTATAPTGVDTGHSGPVQNRPAAAPVAFVQTGAQAYADARGLGRIKTGLYVPVDEATAKRIADAYDALPVRDDSPETRAAYDALGHEVQAQWDHAEQQMHVTFEAWTKDGQPYANSHAMATDVATNKHLYFFTGGDPHPYLDTKDAHGLSLNDKFRAVHDLFGHSAEDYQFGPRGEENAWLKHSQMFSPAAQRALTSETRGQNSWVNFGAHNYNGDGSKKNIPATEKPYATQKTALLPTWASDWHAVLPGKTTA